jgi:hypothetical protein
MEYSATVVQMLGRSRVVRIEESLAAIRTCMASVPDRTSWVKHLPIALTASDPILAHNELVERLRKSGTDWFYVTGVRADGGRLGYASDLFRPQEPYSRADVGQFLLFDIHSSLGGWWLSHLWRAADLAEATCVCLAEWLVLPAAACARALVEGVAAFVIEGEQLLAEWSAFKQRGVPDLTAVEAFRERFHTKLLQAQFGSRLGEREGTRPPPFRRTNVLTLLEKFAERVGGDLLTAYEWLCDAVHPSFGFQTAYVATQGVHKSGATMAADLARRTDKSLTHAPKIEPTVAWAAADVLTISLDAILAELPRLRWFIDDFGLTTGVAFTALELSVGKTPKVKGTANCPCGSGLRFRDCRHAWGAPAQPPSALTER